MPDKGSLYQFLPDQVPPPPGIWSRISLHLDKSGDNSALVELSATDSTNPSGADTFSAGPLLAEMEVAPPAFIWQEIKNRLDKPKSLEAVPVIGKSRSLWIRAFAAAVISGVVVMVGITLKRNNAHALGANMPVVGWSAGSHTDSQITGGILKSSMAAEENDALTSYVITMGINGDSVPIRASLLPLIELLNASKNRQGPQWPLKKMWNQKLLRWLTLPASSRVNFADPVELLYFLQENK
ncbi:MAG: hypothetical protein ABIX01_11540 [Chitinophagaceae bacterium]